MKVVTIVLAKNEAATLERCLKSAAPISSEIIVIDDHSTDSTAAIAQTAGARVIEHALEQNFAQQRNWALAQTNADWVLFVDADEEISPELAAEITGLDETKIASVAGYFIPRYDYWQGKEITLGELHTASSTGFIRLVKKGSGMWEGSVHETWKAAAGSTEQLRSRINHYPHPTVKEFLEKINYYSTVRAKELYAAKVPSSIFHIWAYPLGKFLMSYVVLFGFVHGAHGFIYSFMMSFHSFLVRAKLYQYYHVAPPSA